MTEIDERYRGRSHLRDRIEVGVTEAVEEASLPRDMGKRGQGLPRRGRREDRHL